MARLNELCVKQTNLHEGENDGEGGWKTKHYRSSQCTSRTFKLYKKVQQEIEATAS